MSIFRQCCAPEKLDRDTNAITSTLREHIGVLPFSYMCKMLAFRIIAVKAFPHEGCSPGQVTLPCAELQTRNMQSRGLVVPLRSIQDLIT